MKLKYGLMMMAAGFLAGGVYAGAAESEAKEEAEAKLKPQAHCPIMGGAIDKDQYVDHEGQRIHVCCPPCKARVKADPEAAIATLAEKGEGPGQALCPIMKITVTPKSRYVDHDGQRIYVCCGSCSRRVQADPDAALAVLKEQGVVPAKAEEEAPKRKK